MCLSGAANYSHLLFVCSFLSAWAWLPCSVPVPVMPSRGGPGAVNEPFSHAHQSRVSCPYILYILLVLWGEWCVVCSLLKTASCLFSVIFIPDAVNVVWSAPLNTEELSALRLYCLAESGKGASTFSRNSDLIHDFFSRSEFWISHRGKIKSRAYWPISDLGALP